MKWTLAHYEADLHVHRGLLITGARHNKHAPFACNDPIRLHVQANPLKAGTDVVYEQCPSCGILKVWGVLPEHPNNDADDDGA